LRKSSTSLAVGLSRSKHLLWTDCDFAAIAETMRVGTIMGEAKQFDLTGESGDNRGAELIIAIGSLYPDISFGTRPYWCQGIPASATAK
jgi:hypothetical protein